MIFTVDIHELDHLGTGCLKGDMTRACCIIIGAKYEKCELDVDAM